MEEDNPASKRERPVDDFGSTLRRTQFEGFYANYVKRRQQPGGEIVK